MSSFFHVIIAILMIFEEMIISSMKVDDSKKNKYRVVVFSVTVALYGALRNPLGMVDNYAGEFYQYSQLSFKDVFLNNLEYEPAYRVFVKLVQYIFDDVQALFIIQSLLVSFSFGVFAYRRSSDIFISFFLFLALRNYSLFMCAMRQGIAVAILLLFADYFAQKKKYICFIFSVIVASLFHRSALVFLLIPLLNKKKNDSVFFIPVLYLSAVILRYSSSFLSQIVSYLPIISRYDSYIKSNFNQGGEQVTLYIYIALVIVLYYCVNSSQKNVQEEQRCLAIGTAIEIVGDNYGAFSRVAFYFFPYATLLFPEVLERMEQKQISKIIFVLVLLIQFMIFGAGQVGNNYSFYWI